MWERFTREAADYPLPPRECSGRSRVIASFQNVRLEMPVWVSVGTGDFDKGNASSIFLMNGSSWLCHRMGIGKPGSMLSDPEMRGNESVGGHLDGHKKICDYTIRLIYFLRWRDPCFMYCW